MKLFNSNTWFNHDSLTISKITNINQNMSSDQLDIGKKWREFIESQLGEFKTEIKKILDFVMQNDNKAENLLRVPTKKKINNTVANLNERVFETQDLYFQMNNPKYALEVYFRWFRHCMKGSYDNMHICCTLVCTQNHSY